MQSFQENRLFVFQARVVLKPLVSLKDHLVACKRQHTDTDRQTDQLLQPLLRMRAEDTTSISNPTKWANVNEGSFSYQNIESGE